MYTVPMRKMWPLWAALGAYAAACGVQLGVILEKTHGRQFYPLDDTYIHAAVAKNIVLHGVYGISRFHSSFPCSSILWPFVLAGSYGLFGVRLSLPFALNALFSVLAVVLAGRMLERQAPHLSPALRFFCLLLLVFGVPLVGMTFLGMEHVLQLLALLLLLHAYAAAASPGAAPRAKLLLLFSCFLLPAVRYEGLFAVLMVSFLLLAAGRWALSVLCGSVALMPVVAFGLYGLHRGSTFFPSPLLVKTAGAHQFSLLTWVHTLFGKHALNSGVSLIFILCASMLAYLYGRVPGRFPLLQRLLLIFLGTMLLHSQLAKFGGFFRYEAYLVGAGTVLLFAGVSARRDPSLPPAPRQEARMAAGVLLAVAAAGLGARAAAILYVVPGQAYGVYEQQYQTAQFLHRYYTGQAVALNDIGAPNYFGDINCLDLWGLGSVEVQRLRARNAFDRAAMTRLADANGVRSP